jgi:hypothetical protein
VWYRFGAVPCFVEPFCGSAALLLGRPGGGRAGFGAEIIGDRNAMIVNAYRAIKLRPLEVARWAAWPVSEADLHARRRWLLRRSPVIRRNAMLEPEFCDPRAAGWWLWGMSQWIGSDFCRDLTSSLPPWRRALLERFGWLGPCYRPPVRLKRPQMADLKGVVKTSLWVVKTSLWWRYTPDSKGVNASSLGRRGVLKTRAYHPGAGVTRTLVTRDALRLRDHPGAGVARLGVQGDALTAWMERLADRLRGVRILCRDWRETLRESMTTNRYSSMGVFLDPPYSYRLRRENLYDEDCFKVAVEARRWAVEHGDDPRYRIALCGISGEHEMPEGWSEYEWIRTSGLARNKSTKEAIWFSPYCRESGRQRRLFLPCGEIAGEVVS